MPRRSSIAFSDAFVRRAKAAAGADRSAFYDALTPGLELRVSADGAKSWAYRYRDAGGRSLRLSLGPFPAVGLKAARDGALDARRSVSRGGDPQGERNTARIHAQSQRVRLVRDLAAAFLEYGAAKFRPATLAADRQRLDAYVLPKLGAVRVDTLSRAQVRQLLNDIASDGRAVTANRTGALIGRLYNFAIRKLDLPLTNPAAGLQSAFEEVSRDRTLTDAEFRALWAALDDPASLDASTLAPATALCLKLCALTLQRANEVAGLDEREVDFIQRVWCCPRRVQRISASTSCRCRRRRSRSCRRRWRCAHAIPRPASR